MNILQLRKCVGAISLALLFGVATAFGCSCPTVGADENDLISWAYNKASVVFTGKVVALEYQKGVGNDRQQESLRSRGKSLDFETKVVKFTVESWWKTELPTIFYLATDATRNSDGSGSGSSCDYSFKVGSSYIVYAYGQGRETRTGACSRTAPLTRAQDDLKLIGPGTKPRDDER